MGTLLSIKGIDRECWGHLMWDTNYGGMYLYFKDQDNANMGKLAGLSELDIRKYELPYIPEMMDDHEYLNQYIYAKYHSRYNYKQPSSDVVKELFDMVSNFTPDDFPKSKTQIETIIDIISYNLPTGAFSSLSKAHTLRKILKNMIHAIETREDMAPVVERVLYFIINTVKGTSFTRKHREHLDEVTELVIEKFGDYNDELRLFSLATKLGKGKDFKTPKSESLLHYNIICPSYIETQTHEESTSFDRNVINGSSVVAKSFFGGLIVALIAVMVL